MPLFGHRRTVKPSSKWHDNVLWTVSTAGGVRPAPTAPAGAPFHLFPYTQLQAITKEHLGKKKRTEAEQDQLLIDLIQDHTGYKENAFAACVEHLSAGAVKDVLDSSFQVDLNTSNGLEQYLHAFVAAARWKESLGLAQDRNFALALAPVVHVVATRGIGPNVAQDLLTVWSYGAPSNRLLSLRARAFTQRIFQHVESELNAFKAQLMSGTINSALCDRALRYGNAFAANVGLDESILSHISCWRAWASWEPNVARLKAWASVPKGSIFSWLIELDGPDLRVDQQNCENHWSALIRRGHLLQWLEEKRFTLGLGLITGDSKQLLTNFINSFMDCALDSLRKGSVPILQYLIDKNDLDSHTLRSWQAADTLLDPKFVSLLLPRSGADPDDSDGIMVQGLRALATDITQSVRKPLGKEVAVCVQRTLENLRSVFQLSFATSKDWAGPAARLWMLRSSITASGWLHSELDSSTVAMSSSQAPQHSLSVLQALYRGIDEVDAGSQFSFRGQFDRYVQLFVLQGSVAVGETTEIPHALHSAWLYAQRKSFRDLTLHIASIQTLESSHRLKCIRKLQGVSEEIVHGLQNCFISLEQGDVLEIMNFAIVIGALDQDQCWRALFLCAVRNANVRIDRNEFTTLGYSGYRQCVEALHDLVGGDLELLQSTHSWLEELRSVETTLTSLEADGESYPAIHCILIEQQPEIRRRYLKMLQCYTKETNKAKKTLLQELILALRSTNSAHVSQGVLAISKVDSKGFSQCEDLMMLCRNNSSVASARLALWLKMGNLNDATEAALSSLGKVLNLGLDNDLNPPSTSFGPASKDYARRVAELVARAQQLEKTRLSLTRTDPDGVKAMVRELGLEAPPSGIASLTASLPNNLSNFINEVGDNEVDFSFPLSKDLNAMEHLAFGLKGTETLTVHLQLNERNKFDAFCVHVQNRGDFALQRHNFYKARSPPDRLFCEGTKLTRLTYVIARNLWRAIYEQQETCLKRLYEGIRAVMQAGASLCMVCGSNIGSPSTLRGTICNNGGCKRTYLMTPLDLRLQDVRTNGRVVDLLLTSVFAAANINNLGLLPDRPSQLNNAAKLQVLLNSLPPTATLANAADFTTGLRGCGQRAEVLLSWLCTHRFFVVPATGAYKLPKMNGIHQFLVINNPPEVEATFAVHNHHQQRHVLFHGTSMDRLFPILVQGVRICSNTPLMKNGAASGAGIYTSREPSTAMSYAAATQANNNFNGFFKSRTDFRNSSVMLGLEHAGNDGGGGVHVVGDASRVLLRYIFIIPPYTNAPRASDIVPTMLNTFQSLKTAAAQRSVDGAGSY